MQRINAIIRRELIAYFSSPIAYLVLSGFLLVQGVIFYLLLSILNQPGTASITPLRAFFGGTVFFWLILLFVVPVITMRLIAEEQRSGTIEVLLTSPVGEGTVITGKFLAALFFYLSLWLPTVLYILILRRFSEIDLGPILGGYFGVLLIGFLFLSAGLFCSTLSKNQLIAAVLAFVGLFLLFALPLAEQLVGPGSLLHTVLKHMDLWSHMEDYAMGIIDTRHVIYELSMGMCFLFLASQSLEIRKGR